MGDRKGNQDQLILRELKVDLIPTEMVNLLSSHLINLDNTTHHMVLDSTLSMVLGSNLITVLSSNLRTILLSNMGHIKHLFIQHIHTNIRPITIRTYHWTLMMT